MDCKNGVNKVSFLPLELFFNNGDLDVSLSLKAVKNTKNKFLEPQLQEESETLGAWVQ